MSTDINKFDSWLKENLFRDLAFRSVLWFGISGATAFIAITAGGATPLQYFEKVGSTLGSLANSLGTFGLLLSLLALFLKDLEQTSHSERIREATRGYLAGFVRRTAGDVSLWTLGGLTTLLASFLIALCFTPMKPREYAAVVSLALILLGMAVCTAMANVAVRRAGASPLVSHVKNPKFIALTWTLALFVLVGNLIWRVI